MVERAPVSEEDARRALERFGGLHPDTLDPLGSGLINDTFAVSVGAEDYVLQRVHPVFAPEIHWNILAVTRHLTSHGLLTPVLILADDGRPWIHDDSGVWRLMTRIRGVSFDAVSDPAQSDAAAALLARFHGALADLEHEFVARRASVHDTPRHLETLRQALDEHCDHRLYEQVAPLGEALLRAARTLERIPDVPERVTHGDPKFNNILFRGDDGCERNEAVALIDLDTVGPMALPLELGDAWRSWCNPKGEDESLARFDLDIFEASVHGYARARTMELLASEVEGLVHGVEWITLELSARFAADALAESYFGWNRERFGSAGEHNLVRATGQWSLHQEVVRCRPRRAEILREAFCS